MYGSIIGVITGDTRSVDHGSYDVVPSSDVLSQYPYRYHCRSPVQRLWRCMGRPRTGRLFWGASGVLWGGRSYMAEQADGKKDMLKLGSGKDLNHP